LSEFNWTCPHCERAVTISSPERHSLSTHTLRIEHAEGKRALRTVFIVCPNPECKKFTLTASLCQVVSAPDGRELFLNTLKEWSLIPSSEALPILRTNYRRI